MAPKPRLEVEGGLSRILTPGNNRQRIFGDHNAIKEWIKQLNIQFGKLGRRTCDLAV